MLTNKFTFYSTYNSLLFLFIFIEQQKREMKQSDKSNRKFIMMLKLLQMEYINCLLNFNLNFIWQLCLSFVLLFHLSPLIKVLKSIRGKSKKSKEKIIN